MEKRKSGPPRGPGIIDINISNGGNPIAQSICSMSVHCHECVMDNREYRVGENTRCLMNQPYGAHMNMEEAG